MTSEIESKVPALEVQDLAVEFKVTDGSVKAVRGVSFSVNAGETLAIVGESGCGKSVTMMSLMGLVAESDKCSVSGSAKLSGREILGLDVTALNKIRGVEIGMVFQDPMSALNPTMKVGDQIAETLMVHQGMSKADALKRAVALLDRTKIPEPETRAEQYPFEFSGGMLQRAVIAMSLACNPSVLVADEPTTALDVTIQNQVLELMLEIQREEGMAIVLITHDLAVVAKMADTVSVMYAGQVVEQGSVDDIFYRSAHPYTLGLKTAMPSADMQADAKLEAIPGSPPDLFAPPPGCAYCDRCPHAMNICEGQNSELIEVENGHRARCWLQKAGQAPLIEDLYQVDAAQQGEVMHD